MARYLLPPSHLTNVSRISEMRKDKARVLTELRSREIAAAEALEAEGVA